MFTERFPEALRYAFALHRAQKRKGSDTPYLAHLLGVAGLVLEHEGDEEEAIAALLHDAVEDQGGAATAEAIRAAFGDRVAAIVRECSDTEVTPKPPWRARKEAYVRHLAHASESARLVSAADKLHNARTLVADVRRLGEGVFARFTATRDETLWYYRTVTETLRVVAEHPRMAPLLDELERTVAELDALVARPTP